MKKILILLSTLVLALVVTGCEHDPYYSLAWEKEYGYATYETVRGEKKLKQYYEEDATDVPNEALEVIKYSHPYNNNKTPKLKIIIERWEMIEGDDEDDVNVGYNLYKETNYQELDSRPLNYCNGKFFAYIEDGSVYIISNLFGTDYKPLGNKKPRISNTEKYYKITYYFSGARNYEFEVYKEDSDF
ncbi:MAG: hypothetical protein IK102_10580 [Treponema sp.]|nr:hypothetical protein [Treponema sp.]